MDRIDLQWVQRVKAIFPDAGVAAMVKYQWTDAPFFFGRYMIFSMCLILAGILIRNLFVLLPRCQLSTVDMNRVCHCSLNDRRPVADEDEVVVLLTPDHQGLPDVEKIAGILGGDDDTPV